jgi:endonuclease YncB( thermonuclease family)
MLIDRMTRVRDDDTIVVGLIPVRIANLDCAETETAASERATKRAKQLVANQKVQCRLEGRRSYEREVGVCALVDGPNFGQVMISKGVFSRQ